MLALLAGWSVLGKQISYSLQDALARTHAAGAPVTETVILAIDEQTLSALGGQPQLRHILALCLKALQQRPPRGLAIDVELADQLDPTGDQELAQAIAALPTVVLGSHLLSDGSGWEDPRPEFRQASVSLGHVHAELDEDDVFRRYPLGKVAGRERRWGLALETFRRVTGGGPAQETLDDLTVGPRTIPAPASNGWTMPVHFVETADGRSAIPRVSAVKMLRDEIVRASLHDKVVFLGETALSATTNDRMRTPFDYMSGVDIQAQAFETISRGDFFRQTRPTDILLLCLLIAAGIGAVFWLLSGWRAYLAGGALVLAAHLLPWWLYGHHLLLFPAPVFFTAWLTLIGAAGFQYLVTGGQLARAEAQRSRYLQAIHFVTHEMRTPLTAIQGSSEMMGRYNLNEDKRKQMAQMINAESKRLARMIQTFLDVERLSAGEMDLKTEPFTLPEVLNACLERVRPLAERKQITLTADEMPGAVLTGDRELMEYAVYNLLTNAVKYSPPDTHVHVAGEEAGRYLRLSVQDQGMGLTKKEIRQIFQKFYRTKSAEASGEVGTGIGLSIVEQIITHHGGRIEVTSTPGQGSCFTLVLPPASRGYSN